LVIDFNLRLFDDSRLYIEYPQILNSSLSPTPELLYKSDLCISKDGSEGSTSDSQPNPFDLTPSLHDKIVENVAVMDHDIVAQELESSQKEMHSTCDIENGQKGISNFPKKSENDSNTNLHPNLDEVKSEMNYSNLENIINPNWMLVCYSVKTWEKVASFCKVVTKHDRKILNYLKMVAPVVIADIEASEQFRVGKICFEPCLEEKIEEIIIDEPEMTNEQVKQLLDIVESSDGRKLRSKRTFGADQEVKSISRGIFFSNFVKLDVCWNVNSEMKKE
jgi:hypothetical protein